MATRNVVSRTGALSRWLQFVAFLRFFSVVLGYLYPKTLAENVFASALAESTHLQTRTFAVWTTTSCMLCILCARNIGNRDLYAATFGSFVIALGFFLLEHFVYVLDVVPTISSLARAGPLRSLFLTPALSFSLACTLYSIAFSPGTRLCR